MGHFAARLLLLGNVEKIAGFCNGEIRVIQFADGISDGVIILNCHRVDAARRHFDFGPCNGLGRGGTLLFAMPDERKDVLVHQALIVIDMNPIVADEGAGGSVVSFGINVLTQGGSLGESGRPGLDAVLSCLRQREIGALDLPAVLAGAGERLREIDCQWAIADRRRRSGGLPERNRRAGDQNQRPEQSLVHDFIPLGRSLSVDHELLKVA